MTANPASAHEPADALDPMEIARRAAGISVHDLWRRCSSLGGRCTQLELASFLHGVIDVSQNERDVIAVALDQCFAHGQDDFA